MSAFPIKWKIRVMTSCTCDINSSGLYVQRPEESILDLLRSWSWTSGNYFLVWNGFTEIQKTQSQMVKSVVSTRSGLAMYNSGCFKWEFFSEKLLDLDFSSDWRYWSCFCNYWPWDKKSNQEGGRRDELRWPLMFFSLKSSPGAGTLLPSGHWINLLSY